MNTIFCALRLGQRFDVNGTIWVKKSNRTASLEENGRIFYFGDKERVTILGVK